MHIFLHFNTSSFSRLVKQMLSSLNLLEIIVLIRFELNPCHDFVNVVSLTNTEARYLLPTLLICNHLIDIKRTYSDMGHALGYDFLR